ncbi:glycine cleavage system aminomethyltransferase GcvT [Sulfurisphaera tokodaii]|uniref:aminomethyltransferase n=2 Tax=Sulfurisphaera tokodaii TaxID=111955 RepID=F9VNX5_SULTO|nr:glycine cleavage system aminomethyltransferase GcvT [Sulfurisphaera tokodaii]BAK54483.1 glycine cleavage system T-protein [Sulfurisphaera tokodaii str. 7]HII73226.1 glycine cleavage system aminomethyltransferase GcvT [Sulfurisphaera tokodaii]
MFSTPLLDIELKLNADIGEFAGWKMPMKYTSYQEEHLAVRSSAAFFDLSHMGRLKITGKIDEFDLLIAKDIKKASYNTMIGPTAFLNDKGGFIDDVMTYKLSDTEFLIVTNAINREKVINWIKSNSSLEVEDLTFKYAMIAIQGRNVWNYIEKTDLQPLEFKINTKFLGEEVFLISRSGWTGEDGVEVWGSPEVISKIIQRLISVGVKPSGLICRDSIRQEMGFVLYGEDIDENITPVEARYWVFSLDKQFIGREKIVEQLKNGVEKIRVGLKLKKGERSIPRKDNKIKILDNEIGYVTSSTFSPYLNRVIGMGYINSKYALFGYSANIEIRNRQVEAKLQDFPFI